MAQLEHGLGRVWTRGEGMYLHLKRSLWLPSGREEGGGRRCEQETSWRVSQRKWKVVVVDRIMASKDSTC